MVSVSDVLNQIKQIYSCLNLENIIEVQKLKFVRKTAPKAKGF